MFSDEFSREVLHRELTIAGAQDGPVTEADLAPLPPAAQRYFRAMGSVGKPRIWSFQLGGEGRFKRSPTGAWHPFRSLQYDSRDELTRLFFMRVRAGPVSMYARDTYARGKGRMLVRLFDRLTVADGTGPEFDAGELLTFLDDVLLGAPSMLLGLAVRWTAVDDSAFDVSLADRGTTVKARVFLGADDRPTNLTSTDRFLADLHGHATRTPWSTPVRSWMEVDGRLVPASMEAVWHPEGQPAFSYVDFHTVPGSVAFNVAPGQRPPFA